MRNSCLLMLSVAVTISTLGSVALNAFAQGATVAPPQDLHPPVNIDADSLRAKLMPNNIGLKPRSGNAAGIELPFRLNYSSEAKGLVMPLDPKNEWGVGIGLNLNSPKTIELSPSSSLGLQPSNRTPGILLQKRF